MLCCLNLWAVQGTEKNIQSLPENLQEEALSILHKYQALQKLKPADRKIHLDLDDGIPKSVFSKPGFFSTEDCVADSARYKAKNKAQACTSVGWPDNKSNVAPTGNIEFQIEEDQDGHDTLRTYSEIEFSYNRDGKDQKGTGWIAQDFIAFDETTSSYSDIVVKKASSIKDWVKESYEEICKKLSSKPLKAAPSNENNLKDIATLSKALKDKADEANKQRRSVAGVASALSSSVGMCMLKPPDAAPKKFAGNLAYDQFVLPSLKKMSLPQDVKNEDGQLLTQKDLIAIDSVARTLYTEMASCAELGSQYQMAVARVLLNREKVMTDIPGSKDEFLTFKDEHNSSKTLLSQAATSPVQFSAWNQKIIDFDKLSQARKGEMKALMSQGVSREKAAERARKTFQPDVESGKFYKDNETGLLHSLCPPSDPQKLCYTGKIPDPSSNFAWEHSLKVAVEAVLFPKQFDVKTAELKGIKHYTSNRDSFYDYKQVKPAIEGRQISSKVCLNLWRPKTEAEKKAEVEAAKRKAAHKGKARSKSSQKK